MSKLLYDHFMATNVFNISNKVKQQKKNGKNKRVVPTDKRETNK